MSRVVNVDVDGVLYEVTSDFTTELARQFGPENIHAPEPTNWALTQDWRIRRADKEWTPMTPGEFHSTFQEGVKFGRLFSDGQAVRGAVNGLLVLRDAGWRIRVVTNRMTDDPEFNVMATQSTANWLYDRGVPHDEIVLTNGGKVWATADAVVDDHPDTARWAQPGARNILFNRKWNERTLSLPTEGLVERAWGWAEVTRLLCS